MSALLKIWPKYLAAFMAALVLGLVPQHSGLKSSPTQAIQGLGQLTQVSAPERALVIAEQRLSVLSGIAVGDDLDGLPFSIRFAPLVKSSVKIGVLPQALVGLFAPLATARAPPVLA